MVIALSSTLAHTLMTVMLLLLPETRGRAIASLEAEAPGAAAYPSRPVGRAQLAGGEREIRRLHQHGAAPLE
jgi:hypothetical protein